MAKELTLDLLSCEEWISGEDIAAQLGISRAAVWKQVQALRARGYDIESSTKRGYRLAQEQDLLDPRLILAGLKTEFLGRDLRFHKEVVSTNQVARDLANAGWKDGTLVLAEIQTEGKGRMLRSWHSPPGGVWLSLVLRPNISLEKVGRINMAISVAVAKTIVGLYGLNARIKWPNDILIGERKVSGILTEISAEMDRLDWAVVGIGINANVDLEGYPSDWNATSIARELGRRVSRNEFILHLLLETELAYKTMESGDIYSEWCRLSATLGRSVRVILPSGDLKGTAVSLSEDGALIVKHPEGLRKVLAGDCVHLRASDGDSILDEAIQDEAFMDDENRAGGKG